MVNKENPFVHEEKPIKTFSKMSDDVVKNIGETIFKEDK